MFDYTKSQLYADSLELQKEEDPSINHFRKAAYGAFSQVERSEIDQYISFLLASPIKLTLAYDLAVHLICQRYAAHCIYKTAINDGGFSNGI